MPTMIRNAGTASDRSFQSVFITSWAMNTPATNAGAVIRGNKAMMPMIGEKTSVSRNSKPERNRWSPAFAFSTIIIGRSPATLFQSLKYNPFLD